MGIKKGNLSLITDAWNIGVGLTFSVVAFYLIKGKLDLLLDKNKWHFYSTLFLALIALITFFLYAINTRREISILDDYVKADSIPRINSKGLLTVFALAATRVRLASRSPRCVMNA